MLIKQKQNIFKVGIGVVVFIVALIFIQFKKKNEILGSADRSPRLPDFNVADISGKFINSGQFKGRKLYVQFVSPSDISDLSLFEQIYSHWKDEDIKLVIITKNYGELKLRIDLNNVIVLAKDFDKLKTIFKAPNYGTYYLFDKTGYLINTGRNDIEYDKYLRILLNRLIKNKYFSISEFIKPNENIKNISWLKQAAEIVEKGYKDFYIISLFTSICAGCRSGSIIINLNSFYLKSLNIADVLCIFSDKFNEVDLVSLKSQLLMRFPVSIADQTLSRKWNYLIKEFSEAEITNIVFIIDKWGKIIRILDPNCSDCFESFFLYMFSLGNK